MHEIKNLHYQILEEAWLTYGSRRDILGIDIGFKYKDNQRLDLISLRFLVPRKLPKSKLTKDELLPERLGTLITDVIAPRGVAQSVLPHSERRQHQIETLQPGLGIRNQEGQRGTLGLIVYCRKTGKRALLSCAHVLGIRQGRLNTFLLRLNSDQFPDHIHVATLERLFLDRDGDAAISILNNDHNLTVDPAQFESNVVVTSTRCVRLGEVLDKSGFRTGVTSAFVDGIGRYIYRCRGEMRLGIDGFRLIPANGAPVGELGDGISAGGDSGSVWYRPNQDKKTAAGVGLHLNGNPEPPIDYAIACHLPRVLARLNLSLKPIHMETEEIITVSELVGSSPNS